MKIYIKGYQQSEQGRIQKYSNVDKYNHLPDIKVKDLADVISKLNNEEYGEAEQIDIIIRHKLDNEMVEQDERYIKAVGIDLEKRLLISFGQIFIISMFVTLYLALTGTIENYYNIIHGDSIGSIIGLFLVNGIVFGMVFSFGISNMIFLIRYMVFQYKERKRVKNGNE